MNFPGRVPLCAALLCALPAFAVDYSVTCSSADYVVAEATPPLLITGISTLRVGANNNNSTPSGRNAFLIFAMPTLATNEHVISATLAVSVAGRSGSPTFNGDLWGVGFQTNTTAMVTYFEGNGPDGLNTKLQDNIFTPSTSAGLVTSTDTTTMANYLQSFYNANPSYHGGSYVFLRLNPDADSGTNSLGWSVSSGETTNAAVLTLSTSASNNATRTNFVLIITDDQRWDSVGIVQREMGSSGRFFPWFTNGTPNMDRIAAGGIRFRNGFVVLSLCSPSRGAMLTGQYNHLNGIINNSTAFPTNVATVATRLRTAGYVTGMVGKWHMGSQVARPGFDYSASFTGQGNYNDNNYYVNGVSTATTGWVDDVTTDFALNFINANYTKPFLIWIGYKSTHAPHTPPDWATNLYSTASAQHVPNLDVLAPWKTNATGVAGDATIRNYHRCLTAVDADIGRVLDRLDQLGQTTNTVVIFIGDNGFYLGEHNLGDKRSVYEESLRVPLMIRYPRLITTPQVRNELALNIDIPATILDLAGLPVAPEMQGRSWRPLFEGGAVTNWRQSFLAEYFLESGFTSPTLVSVRTTGNKLTLYPGNTTWSETFDVINDRYEITNLFNIPAFQTSRDGLKTELDRLCAETGLGAQLLNAKRSNNVFQMNIAGGLGPLYQFEEADRPDLQTWTPINQIKMTNTTATATATNATQSQKFYRLRWISD